MCGACGSGTIRPPWEVILAGDRPADRRRRANAAAHATGERVKVSPWGAAGYLLTPRIGPIRTFPSLTALAAVLLPDSRLPMPECGPCGHRESECPVRLPADADRGRLAVWSALATVNSRLAIEIHAPCRGPLEGSRTSAHSSKPPIRIVHSGIESPRVVLRGPHAEDYAAGLAAYLGMLTHVD